MGLFAPFFERGLQSFLMPESAQSVFPKFRDLIRGAPIRKVNSPPNRAGGSPPPEQERKAPPLPP